MRHITELTSQDYVRIFLSSRSRLVYKSVGPQAYNLVNTSPGKRERVWESSLISGGIETNNFVDGYIEIGGVSKQGPDVIYSAIIPYSIISMLHVKIVEDFQVEVPEFLKGVSLGPKVRFERVRF